MANISLDFLKNSNDDRKNVNIYSDIKLDLKLNKTFSDELNKTLQISDLQSDVNAGAIQNSIISILTTSPGEKLLNPLFGCNFGDLLFLPVTESRARLIGQSILDSITRFEPRVKVINVNVEPVFDDSTYIITISIQVPRFKTQQITFKGTLDKAGFYINK